MATDVSRRSPPDFCAFDNLECVTKSGGRLREVVCGESRQESRHARHDMTVRSNLAVVEDGLARRDQSTKSGLLSSRRQVSKIRFSVVATEHSIQSVMSRIVPAD